MSPTLRRHRSIAEGLAERLFGVPRQTSAGSPAARAASKPTPRRPDTPNHQATARWVESAEDEEDEEENAEAECDSDGRPTDPEKRMESLEAEIAQTNSTLSDTLAANDALHKQIEKLKADQRRVRAENFRLKRDNPAEAKLAKEVESLKAEQSQLRSENSHLRQEGKNNSGLANEIRALKQEVIQLKQAAKSTPSSADRSAATQVTELKQREHIHILEIIRLERERDQLKEAKEKLEKSRDISKKSSEAKDRTCASLREDKRKLQQETDRLKKDLDNAKRPEVWHDTEDFVRIEKLKDEIAALERKVATLDDKNDSKRRELDSLRRDMQAMGLNSGSARRHFNELLRAEGENEVRKTELAAAEKCQAEVKTAAKSLVSAVRVNGNAPQNIKFLAERLDQAVTHPSWRRGDL
ncbi:uncharacterized protein J3D65DRAFT_685154 [Phyllosticta citribraziliensis]|uniref:Uncharacterized protein n=1 Tax=Phyllosticta citribraziliensis TaxID=989973 RepID=A0ABR1LBC6_9PEZI